MKKILFAYLALLVTGTRSQTIYSETFGGLQLATYTINNISVNYTTVPSGFDIINDGRHNSSSLNNAPFNVPLLKTQGWAVVYNSVENDTFLVGTSWLDTAQAVNRWVITPPVSNITANTVFTWLAKSPDASFPESYEVYATNKTGSLTANDFTIGDKLLTVAAEQSQWTTHSIDISAFAGQTLRFAFKNISNDKFQVWIDDIAVTTVANSLDGGLTSLFANKYFLTNSNQSISVLFKNNGASNINSVTLNYKYGSSIITSGNYTINALGYGETIRLNIPQTFAISTAGNYPLKVWLSNPNNSADQNNSNDTLTLHLTAQNSAPQKNILVEQFVSAMNGESADAQEKLKAMESSSVIVVNIHHGDSLKEQNSGDILSYRKQYATAIIDRAYDDSLASFPITRAYYNNRIQKQLASVSPASVSIINKNYDPQTRELSFTLKADFEGDAKGDYRFNAYLVERHVHGPAADTSVNGYNQLSNYYNTPWSPYFQKGYYSAQHGSWVLNAAQYKHHNTLIHAFDQSFGSTGVIPQNGGTAGQSYQQTFTLTLPTSTNTVSLFNPDNIFIAGFITEFGSLNSEKRIINTTFEKLTSAPEIVSANEYQDENNALIYPNPAKDVVYIVIPKNTDNIAVSVYDITGKLMEAQMRENINILTLNISGLSSGVYLLEIRTANAVSHRKLMVEN